MMADNGNSAASVLVAFAVGAAWAPRSHCCTPRPRARKRAEAGAERAREGREKAETLAREGREFLNRQRDNLTAAVERGREAYESARKETCERRLVHLPRGDGGRARRHGRDPGRPDRGRASRDEADDGDREEIRREVMPLVAKAHRISDDAARVASMAVVQIERVDRLLALTADRVNETLAVIQPAVIEPVRQGAAVLTAMRAAVSAFRDWRNRPTHARTGRRRPPLRRIKGSTMPQSSAAVLCSSPSRWCSRAGGAYDSWPRQRSPPASTSAAKAKELAALLQARKLEAFAARMPNAARPLCGRDRRAWRPVAGDLGVLRRADGHRVSCTTRNSRTRTTNLKLATLSTDRFFVDDALRDGLVAVPGRNPLQTRSNWYRAARVRRRLS